MAHHSCPIHLTLAVVRETPGLDHMAITVRTGAKRRSVGEALGYLIDRGLLETRPLPRGSRCALAYYATERA